MTLYSCAYREDGTQVLGNLDGQTSFISVRDYQRTHQYKALKSGHDRPRHPRIAYWQIEDSLGHVFEVIPNPTRSSECT
jgi:hypothetical protein